MTGPALNIIHGDCVEAMRGMAEASVDAVVCDPPYGLGFMGREWDHLPPGVEFATEALRVLKPGGHLLAFGGTRTYHRLACAVEDAGFEIRDCLAWMYASGFPKSMDVAKAIDKAHGERGERGPMKRGGERLVRQAPDGERDGQGRWGDEKGRDPYTYVPSSDAARGWDGWGTALKPAFEPVVVARKPLIGTVAANVQAHGTGGLNIDGCRIGTEGEEIRAPQSDPSKRQGVVGTDLGITRADIEKFQEAQRASIDRMKSLGRWPANVVLDEEAGRLLDEQSGERSAGSPVSGMEPSKPGDANCYGVYQRVGFTGHGDSGGASRFFYCAKASRAEREAGLDGMPRRVRNITEGHGRGEVNTSKGDGTGIRENRPAANVHPTVKPVSLMRWLVRLVTPPGGTVLDPFLGSGTTGIAAVIEGFRFVGIEREAEYIQIATSRINHWRKFVDDPAKATDPKAEDPGQGTLFGGEA